MGGEGLLHGFCNAQRADIIGDVAVHVFRRDAQIAAIDPFWNVIGGVICGDDDSGCGARGRVFVAFWVHDVDMRQNFVRFKRENSIFCARHSFLIGL